MFLTLLSPIKLLGESNSEVHLCYVPHYYRLKKYKLYA